MPPLFGVVTFLLISSFLVGCAVPKYNYLPIRIEISEPPLGSTNIVHVGDNMLRQGNYTEHEAIFLNTTAVISWAYTATRGYYLKRGEDQESEFYQPSNDSETGQIVKAAIADAYPFENAPVKGPLPNHLLKRPLES
jgi:hypothetical protein